MSSPHAINIYTDGSAKPNPGPSGYGIVICYPDGSIHKITPFGYKVSTNNRTELKACVDALKYLQTDIKARGISHVCIHSDSQYVVDNYKNVIYGTWQSRDWKTLDGNDVDNQNIWKDLLREVKKVGKRVEIYKIKGHAGNIHNEEADKLAEKSRNISIRDDFPSKRTQVRRWLKIPENKAEIVFDRPITIFIQRTDPRKDFFDVHGQVLRPKEYFGARIKMRGEIDKHTLRGAHIYKIKLEQNKDSIEIKEILTDLGKSSENKNLLKISI